MKISFEGKTIHDVLEEMQSVLALYSKAPAAAAAPSPAPDLVANALPDIVPVDKPVEKPVEKPVKPERTEKQKANDERLRAAAHAKIAAKSAKKAEQAELLFDEPQGPGAVVYAAFQLRVLHGLENSFECWTGGKALRNQIVATQ